MYGTIETMTGHNNSHQPSDMSVKEDTCHHLKTCKVILVNAAAMAPLINVNACWPKSGD